MKRISAVSMLWLLSVAVLFAVVSCSEIDEEDLIFDDLSDLGNWKKYNRQLHLKEVTPVLSPREVHKSSLSSNEGEENGLWTNVVGTSLKRAVMDWFGWSDSDAPRTTDDSRGELPEEIENTRSHRNTRSIKADSTVLGHSRLQKRQSHPTDDEDFEANSGSGDERPITNTELASPSQPVFYRITLNVQEPYKVIYRDANSVKEFTHNLAAAIMELYKALPGTQGPDIISIEKVPHDGFWSKVTLDLGTLNYYDKNSIKNTLYEYITTNMKLGPYTVTSDNFTFNVFNDTITQCQPGEIKCNSGECLPSITRCDNFTDCRDGSDEEGCRNVPTSLPHSGSSQGVLPILPQSEGNDDRCRADDKVRCADGSVFICTDQQCDGKRDCPGGDDEENCPDDKNDCAAGEFMCDISRCIPLEKMCDNSEDCRDGTDERNCPNL